MNDTLMNSGISDNRVILISSPLCWVSGVWQLLQSIVYGFTRVFTTFYDDVHTMQTIEKHRVNSWMAAPTALFAFVSAYKSQYQSRYDLSSLHALLVGGSRTGADVQQSIERGLGCSVTQVYGVTEAGFVFGPAEGEAIPPGSMGKLLNWCEIRLVSTDTGEDIPASSRNVVGELRVRSPYLMLGYVNNPEETAKAFDEQGFYKTGDLMYEDDDGFFYFVDRIKEMLKYMNKQIAPAEVEMVLLQHPGVKEACVLGKPDAALGDVLTAFVARAPNEAGSALTEDELKALVTEKLSEHKQLRGGVTFLDQLPRTVSGKVARRELKDRLKNIG